MTDPDRHLSQAMYGIPTAPDPMGRYPPMRRADSLSHDGSPVKSKTIPAIPTQTAQTPQTMPGGPAPLAMQAKGYAGRGRVVAGTTNEDNQQSLTLDAQLARMNSDSQQLQQAVILSHANQRKTFREYSRYLDNRTVWRDNASDLTWELEEALRAKSGIESRIEINGTARSLYIPGAPTANTFMATFDQNIIDCDCDALVRAIRRIDDCEKAVQLHAARRPIRPSLPVINQLFEIDGARISHRPRVIDDGGGASITAVDRANAADCQGTTHHPQQGDAHDLVDRGEAESSQCQIVNDGSVVSKDDDEVDGEQVDDELYESDA